MSNKPNKNRPPRLTSTPEIPEIEAPAGVDILTLPHIQQPEPPMQFGIFAPPEPEPNLDLEFDTQIIKLCEIPDASGRKMTIDPLPGEIVKAMYDDGWEIEKEIICPPFALIVFSREKEIEEEEEQKSNEQPNA